MIPAVARRAIDHAMDARALNLEQTSLIFNLSPELDSLAEVASAFRRAGAPPELVVQMTSLCRRILQSNVREGNCQSQVTGMLERQLVAARSQPLQDRLTAKAIARRVRGPLDVLLRPDDHTALEYFAACGALRDVIAACPREHLLAPAVRHELRDRKYGLLSELAASIDGAGS